MDSRKLKYFLEVADAGTFTKAAERLFVAQSAVSKTIQKLEDELLLTLFDRGEKKAVLTPEGRVLMKHAHVILGKLEDAAREMNELVELILIFTGRLTNLALALRQDPELPAKIAKLVIMGDPGETRPGTRYRQPSDR